MAWRWAKAAAGGGVICEVSRYRGRKGSGRDRIWFFGVGRGDRLVGWW
jgi:hypothetical protein